MDTSLTLKRTLFAILTVAVVGLPLVLLVFRKDLRPPTGKSVQEAERQWELYERRVRQKEAQRRERIQARRRMWHAQIVDYGDQLVLRPTAVQSNEAAEVFARIAEAYRHEQVDDMRKYIGQCPGYVTNIVDYVYDELTTPCARSFCDSFTHNDVMKEFRSVSEFERYAESNVEMAKFLGRLDLQRGAYYDYLKFVEALTYKRLKDYKDKFHREGKKELEKAAGHYVEIWVKQIESPNGFTRRHMWHYAYLQYPLVENGTMTPEKLHAWVIRYGTSLLSRFGYTPKWVGEFSVITNTPLLPASTPLAGQNQSQKK